jgi:uncharacterized membrane protein YhaH (DUF805 family)
MNWYLQVLRKYADFSGRARRTEFWTFSLLNLIFGFIIGFIDGVIGTFNEDIGIGLLGGLFMLIIIIPGLAVTVRRLHDVGKSGWMLLIVFIPFIGAIWLFILYVTDSNPGENKYGPNPKKDKGDNEFEEDTNEEKVENKYESNLNEKGENALKVVIKENSEEIDSFSNIIIMFLISVFIGCASYALLSITQIIDGFQNSERIKNVVLIVFALASFIILLNSSLKQANK